MYRGIGNRVKSTLEGQIASSVAEQVAGGELTPADATHPSSSVIETRRQFEKLQAFLYAASFEPDPNTRLNHLLHVRNLLRANESILSTMAQRPGQFGYPLPTQVQAVIVSAELATAALGDQREHQAYLSAAPSGPSLTLQQFQQLQRYQRDATRATGLAMPRAEMLVRDDVRKLFEHLGFNYGVCYPNTPVSPR